MAPFVDRTIGPNWFRNKFTGVSHIFATSIVFWEAFLTPTLLSTRIKLGTHGLGFTSYQPNLMAKQFGLSQMIPTSLYNWSYNICWFEIKLTPKNIEIAWCSNIINSLNYQLSHFSTLSFQQTSLRNSGQNISKAPFLNQPYFKGWQLLFLL